MRQLLVASMLTLTGCSSTDDLGAFVHGAVAGLGLTGAGFLAGELASTGNYAAANSVVQSATEAMVMALDEDGSFGLDDSDLGAGSAFSDPSTSGMASQEMGFGEYGGPHSAGGNVGAANTAMVDERDGDREGGGPGGSSAWDGDERNSSDCAAEEQRLQAKIDRWTRELEAAPPPETGQGPGMCVIYRNSAALTSEAINLLRQCPSLDPTGQQVPELVKSLESARAGASQVCIR